VWGALLKRVSNLEKTTEYKGHMGPMQTPNPGTRSACCTCRVRKSRFCIASHERGAGGQLWLLLICVEGARVSEEQEKGRLQMECDGDESRRELYIESVEQYFREWSSKNFLWMLVNRSQIIPGALTPFWLF
jgi:hypothetical protein